MPPTDPGLPPPPVTPPPPLPPIDPTSVPTPGFPGSPARPVDPTAVPVPPTDPSPDIVRPADPTAVPRPTETLPGVVPPVIAGTLPGADIAAAERDFTVPTMDDVRSKIEGRFARAGGQSELDSASAEGRQQAQTEAERARAAQDVLAKIRESMRGD